MWLHSYKLWSKRMKCTTNDVCSCPVFLSNHLQRLTTSARPATARTLDLTQKSTTVRVTNVLFV